MAAETNPNNPASQPERIAGLVKLLNSYDTLSSGQATATGSAGVLVAARTTAARLVTLINTHASDTLYVGPSGVTTGTGFPIGAGKSMSFTTTAAIYGIRGGSNNITVGYTEEYFA